MRVLFWSGCFWPTIGGVEVIALIRMLIQHDGEVCNCCEDTHGDFKLGNVYQHSLEELWFSERHVRVVTDLITGLRQHYELCRNCPLSSTGPPPEGIKIDILPRRYVQGAGAPSPDSGADRRESLK